MVNEERELLSVIIVLGAIMSSFLAVSIVAAIYTLIECRKQDRIAKELQEQQPSVCGLTFDDEPPEWTDDDADLGDAIYNRRLRELSEKEMEQAQYIKPGEDS